MDKQTQDSLELLPPEKWGDLQKEFKRDWPRSITGYWALETQKDWKKRGIKHDFDVYCPYGDVRNGMVAVQAKGQFRELVIQCPSDNTRHLEEALRRTKIIRWDTITIVPCPPSHITRCIHAVLEDINMNIPMAETPHYMFLLAKETPMFKDIRLPKDVTFERLSEEHVDIVDSCWVNRFKGSDIYFKMLIEAQNGYGLFEGNQLACFIFMNEVGFLIHLFTRENFRRKGYAEILMKLVCNLLIEEQKDSFFFVKHDNKNANNLYEKLGFKKHHMVLWGFLTPTTSKSNL